MLSKQELLQFLGEYKDVFRTKFHIKKIGIIGSYAKGTQTPDSDIDIIIEREAGISNVFDIDWEFRKFLFEKLNKKIDICVEKFVKPYARPFILKDVIYA